MSKTFGERKKQLCLPSEVERIKTFLGEQQHGATRFYLTQLFSQGTQQLHNVTFYRAFFTVKSIIVINVQKKLRFCAL